LLRGDAGRSATAVREGVTVPLNQQQFDALVSFTFNVGTGAFSGSTLLTRLNAGEYDAVRRTSGPAIPGPRDVARHELRGEWMATNRPDPGEFLELAQRMLRELFGDSRSDDDPWAEATRRHRERSDAPQGDREPSAERQRENLTFALATRRRGPRRSGAQRRCDPSVPRAHGHAGLKSAAREGGARPERS
jgi:hypothetical protein